MWSVHHPLPSRRRRAASTYPGESRAIRRILAAITSQLMIVAGWASPSFFSAPPLDRPSFHCALAPPPDLRCASSRIFAPELLTLPLAQIASSAAGPQAPSALAQRSGPRAYLPARASSSKRLTHAQEASTSPKCSGSRALAPVTAPSAAPPSLHPSLNPSLIFLAGTYHVYPHLNSI